MVLHDPNLAMLYADTVFLMEKGHIIASGIPFDIITCENIKRLYGFDVEIVSSNGRRFILPQNTYEKHRILLIAIIIGYILIFFFFFYHRPVPDFLY